MTALRARGFILTTLLVLLVLLVLALVAALGLGLYMLRLDGVVREKFEGKRWAIPARVYARPLELYSGAPMTPQDVLDELLLLHYRQQAPASAGSWQRQGSEILVHTRGFTFGDGIERPQVLRLRFAGGRAGRRGQYREERAWRGPAGAAGYRWHLSPAQ